MSTISLSTFLDAKFHMGHHAKIWNPKMLPFIFTEKYKFHILNLTVSAKLLCKTVQYLQRSILEGKQVLFVGTKLEARDHIMNQAKICNSYYINKRWVGGLLTNWVTVKNCLTTLRDYEKNEKENKYQLLTKKELSLRRKELQRLKKNLNGVKSMTKIPDIVVIIDQIHEKIAVEECNNLKIPLISILDTDSNPDCIDMPIPGNDDSLHSIHLILQVLANTILSSKKA